MGRRGSSAGVVALIAAMLTTTSCGLGEGPPDAYVAFAGGGGASGSTDQLTGRLAVEDVCLWVASDSGDRHLPIWPASARAYGVPDGPGVVVDLGGRRVTVGNSVTLGGVELTDIGAIVSSLAAPIPTACAAGPFWSVSGFE